MNFYIGKINSILKTVESSKEGLTKEEARIRLEKHGENKLQEAKKKSFLTKVFSQFKDVMIILLLISACISLVFAFIHEDGSSEYIDAIIIFAIVILNAMLGAIQESKAENAMASLKKMSQPFSRVIRDGKEVFVNTAELVVGDIVLLEAGDVVPADLRLLESVSLKCDEAMLTGESSTIEKDALFVCTGKTPLGDRKNMCFSSSVVTYGKGVGVVVTTGHDTEIGHIANMLNKEKDSNSTTLQHSLNKFGKIITAAVLSIAIIIFFIDIFFTNQHWSESLMSSVAIAVAAIPESLMIVVTIILSMGVTKLAKRNVIIRKLHSVETLGCCEIICSDKTGTITQNKMTVRKIYFNNTIKDESNIDKKETHQLFINMVLCNDAKHQDNCFIGDPTETALLQFANKFGYRKNKLEKSFTRINEIPFDSNRKLMTTLNKINDDFVQHTKGAVDVILKKCNKILINGKIRKIKASDIENIKDANSAFGLEALRVLGYAVRKCKDKNDIEENGLTFVGLTGMIDPPRQEVYDALKKCQKAGMKAIMITGDHKDTACAIAKELGIVEDSSQVIEGEHLDKFSDEQLKVEIQKFNVFSRVTPEHKVRIVNAFKSLGKVVAMTGDGVNDAPSIKSADIGIGMGITGTEVTKEVADIVLTDDNFATIVIAVEEGRKIYANIQKTIQFLISCNIAEVLSILLATIIFPNLTFLLAIQILFINLITDSLPAIALGQEKADKDIMLHKPRKIEEGIINKKILFNMIYQGAIQSLLVVGVYTLGNHLYSPMIASTMGFLTLNLIQLIHMYNVRTNTSIFKSNPLRNKMVQVAFIVGIVLLSLISLVPAVATVFHLSSLNLQQWGIVIGFAFLIVPIVEFVKIISKVKIKNK